MVEMLPCMGRILHLSVAVPESQIKYSPQQRASP